MHRSFGFLAVLVVFLVSLPVVAEDTPTAPIPVNLAPALSQSPAASGGPAPQSSAVISPDTDLFRRTPVIDGVISDGEWDTYYTYSSGGWQVTTYANWDSSNLYVAAKSNKPIDFLSVIDANADGWFHGDENYEFKATRAADGSLVLAVCRYDSRNTKSPTAAPVSAAEAGTVLMRSTAAGDVHSIEMKVPEALIRGKSLTAGRKIGFQIAVKTQADESSWIPTSQLGDIRECTLVTKKFAALKPLELGFDLRDSVVARGEDLTARFHLTNGGTESIDARHFVIAGEGRAGDYLSSQKIRIEGLPAKKHVAHNIRTLIPTDMPVGAWALGAEVSSGENRLGAALVSFEVVDPFVAELRLPSAEVRADVKDVTFGVVIKNNRRNTIRGKAKITLPVGWELWRSADTRDFSVSGGGIASVSFKAKPPLGEIGVVPVRVEVSSEREVKTLEGKFTMVNP